jgi:hypothetical protein
MDVPPLPTLKRASGLFLASVAPQCGQAGSLCLDKRTIASKGCPHPIQL